MLIQARIKKSLFTYMTHQTYTCNNFPRTIFRFHRLEFQLNTYFPSQICGFTEKKYQVTQRSVSQENALNKKEQKPVGFSPQNYTFMYIFTLIKNNFCSGFKDTEI